PRGHKGPWDRGPRLRPPPDRACRSRSRRSSTLDARPIMSGGSPAGKARPATTTHRPVIQPQPRRTTLRPNAPEERMMITEIVTFPLPPGCDREGALKLYRQTAENWARNPDLVRKYYFFDPERGLGGGVYIWRSRDAAGRWHGDDYRNMVRGLYGSAP